MFNKLIIPFQMDNHYWAVEDSTDPVNTVYSSAKADYVSVTDPTYLAWADSGHYTTTIETEAELFSKFTGVFVKCLPLNNPARQAAFIEDYINIYINDPKFDYDSYHELSLWLNNSRFAKEATEVLEWVQECLSIQFDVKRGHVTYPDLQALEAALPVFNIQPA